MGLAHFMVKSSEFCWACKRCMLKSLMHRGEASAIDEKRRAGVNAFRCATPPQEQFRCFLFDLFFFVRITGARPFFALLGLRFFHEAGPTTGHYGVTFVSKWMADWKIRMEKAGGAK